MNEKQANPVANIPFLDVYVAGIPTVVEYRQLSPIARDEEIRSIRNDTVKRQKYCVWRLLEYGLRKSLGMEIAETDIQKSETGKWIASDFFFSLSHSGNAVAVAISSEPVGIDIEMFKQLPHEERFAEYILTESERAALQALPNTDRNAFLIKKWTAKESTFKRGGGASFQPSKTESGDAMLYTDSITIGAQNYMLSVSSEISKIAKLHRPTELQKKFGLF